jgi:hypothetical protein
MPRKYWLETSLADLANQLTNFSLKIATQGTVLGWTPAQVTAAQDLCTMLLTAYNYSEASKTTSQGVNNWREMVFNGEPVGASAGQAPAFMVATVLPYTRGGLQQFIALRDQIVANPNYTEAIGEDLGIVGAEIAPKPEGDITPNLKVTVTSGTDNVTVGGSMQGASAMQITYTPKGGVSRQVAFVTKTPVEITITKADPLEPENGSLQAQFYKKNELYGNPSAVYPITLG